jgi:NtrC-family two-component system sensor histidine kinase KinB
LKAIPDEKHEKVIFTISDNGPGIEDQYKNKIFEKFEARKLGLHNKPSVGLGLAFCKLAVKAHHGEIWVEDNPAGGSIFIFYLPVYQKKAVTPFDKEIMDNKEQANGK